MTVSAKLIIDPKKWLGDNKIMKMDWDVKAMHFHLILISWQNIPQATIEDDHSIICKYLNISLNDDWEKRIWPQLKASWVKHEVSIDGEIKKLLIQPGLSKEIDKQLKSENKKSKTSTKKQTNNISIDKIDDIENPGFDLNILIQKDIFKKNNKISLSANIWTLGTELIKTDDCDEKKSRYFLAKLAKEYGSEQLANAISQLGMRKTTPIEAKAYLVGTLKKNKLNENKNIKHNAANGNLIL